MLCASLMTAAVTIAPIASPASASTRNPVTDWSEISQNAVTVGRPPGSALVLEGILAATIYDATVAIQGGYEPFVATPRVPRRASLDAAVATAAKDVLVTYVDDVPGQVQYVLDRYDQYMAPLPNSRSTRNGIDVGAEVAREILEWRDGDGFDASVQYVQPVPGPGVFEPVLPAPPVDVKLKQVRPLTLTSNDEFRPGPPNALTSDAYARDFDEVKAYGRVDSAVRTTEQTQIAYFWSENSAIQWPRTMRAIALEHGLGTAATARILALTQVSGADAILGCFDAKYHYLFWRPIHAIQRADTDGNPATEADTAWTPLLYVNHPEYPGAHGCYTTAVTRALRSFFGTDHVPFSISSTVTGTTTTFGDFCDAAEQVYDARTWAGLHFRSSTMAGAAIGRKVARSVVASFFRPL